MSSKLVDMELDEISLVRKGANQHSVITIAKSLQGEEEEMEDELFFEDGTPVNVDDLAEGDIVFDSEGGAYEITADDEGDDYDEDEDGDEEIGKAFPSTKGLVDTAITIDGTLIAVGEPVTFPTTFDSPIPVITPIIPPILVSTEASVRNCPRIVFLRAPIAFFNPISLVRSVTETNMIFMTPIPPTRREILAIQIS